MAGTIASGDVEIRGQVGSLHKAMAEAKGLTSETMKQIGAQRAEPKIDLDLGNLIRKSEQINAELKKIDAMKADPSVGLDTAVFDARAKELEAQKALLGKNIDIVVNLDKRGLGVARTELAKLNQEFVDGRGPIRTWLSNIGRVRVQAGFTSLSIKQLGIVLATLGPVLLGLVGAAAALAGSLGAALAGAAATGAGALGGFALSTFGVVAALKPAITQFGQAHAALLSYNKAVLLYGKGSTQAKLYQDQLNSALKTMSPAARGAFTQLQNLTSAFQSRTGATRANFFRDISSALTTAKSLLPDFARQTNATFAAASQGFQKWMQGLRSPEAQSIMNNLMSNFRSALPDLMAGLGDLATAIGRIASVGSDFFGGFAHGFASWAHGFASATANTSALHSTIAGLVSQTHSWIALLGSLGRLLTTVFMGGAHAGQDLVDTLTQLFNRWNAFLKTDTGQSKMADFFNNAVALSKQFGAALGKAITILFDLSRATEPFAAGILMFANVAGDIGHFIASLKVLRPLLEAVGIAFAGIWIGNKIGAAIEFFMLGLAKVAGFLGIATTEQTAMTAASVEGAAAIQAEAVAAQELAVALGEADAAAGVLDAEMVAAGGASSAWLPIAGGAAGATTAIEGAAASTAGLDLVLGGATVALGGFALGLGTGVAALGLYYLATRKQRDITGKFTQAQKDLNKTLGVKVMSTTDLGEKRNIVALSNGLNRAHLAVDTLGKSTSALEMRQKTLALRTVQTSAAIEKFGKHSLQAQVAMRKQHNAEQALVAEGKRHQAALQSTNKNYEAAIAASRNLIHHLDQERAARRSNAGFASRYGQQTVDLDKKQAQAERELNLVLQDRALALLNVSRQAQHNAQVQGRAAQSVARFAQSFKSAPEVQNVLIKTNSAQAVKQISSVGNQLDKVGHHDQVVRIIANADNAQQAIKRLDQARDALGKHVSEAMPVNAQTDAANHALGVFSQNADQATQPRTATITANTAGAIGAVAALGAAIAAISSKTVTVTTNFVTHHLNNAEGGMIPPFAGGGLRGQKVTRPTILTGEEAPAHPEFVIATNPAYHNANVGYLTQAAGALGFMLIPAFAKGGHRGGRLKGSAYEKTESLLDYLDSRYSNDRQNYDDDLAAGRPADPSLSKLIGEKQKSIEIAGDLKGIIRHMLKKDRHQAKHDPKVIRHLKSQIRSKQHHLNQLQGKAHPTHADHQAMQNLQQEINRKTNHLNHLKSQLQSAKSEYPALFDELVHGLPSRIYGYKNDIQNLKDEQSGAAAAAGLEYLTYGQGRLDLLKSFGGNFEALGAAFSAPLSRFGTSQVPSPQTLGPLAGGGAPASQAGSQGGTTINQTNNFAAPPPDPHTWSKRTAFEAAVAA